MEVIVETITKETVLLITGVFAIIGYTVKNVYLYYYTKLKFKQETDHRIIVEKTNIQINELKEEAERHRLLADELLKHKLNRNVLKDGLLVIDILKEIQEEINAKSVSILVFHNSIAKGFKNYSIRFQEARTLDDSTIATCQAAPLSPYFRDINRFEKEDFIIYFLDDFTLKNNKKNY